MFYYSTHVITTDLSAFFEVFECFDEEAFSLLQLAILVLDMNKLSTPGFWRRNHEHQAG